MKDFLGEIAKGIFGLFEQAWEGGWLLYFILILLVLIGLFIWSGSLFTPSDIFD